MGMIDLSRLANALKKECSGLDPRSLRPVELTRLLNSTPLGEVINERKLYRHRSRAGVRIGDEKSIDLFRYAAWLFDQRCKELEEKHPSPDPVENEYERRKERERARQAEASKKGRDIGPIPEIINLKRREACRFDLKLFCETYNPIAFKLGWSEDHLTILRKIEQAILYGGMFAFAMPRGFGKSTLCRMATLWAIAYCHTRYVFIIGANAPKAIDNLSAVKIFILLPKFTEDFPEIAIAFHALGGVANRASGQLCCGKNTSITYEKEKLVLPTVPPPENWPAEWPLSINGMAPTSGSIIGVSGLTGDGIRGSLHTTGAGEMVRPGVVLLDDPQTDESARSVGQNKTREDLINGSVLGMEGEDEQLSVMMPCTVIHPDDMVDRMLDRKRNPLWRGERSGILRSMPTNMEKWDEYFQVFYRCNDHDPPDFTEANEFYKQHREELDEGAEASWPDKKRGCVSAIQFAMNKFCIHKEKAFWSEYMNKPLGEDLDGMTVLEPLDVMGRFNGYAQRSVPQDCAFVVGMIDIHDDVLYWSVGAFDQVFTGYGIDYGTWPKQAVAYFLKRQARNTLTKKYRGVSTEDAVGRGVADLIKQLFETKWAKPDKTPLQLTRLVIDQGYEKTRKNVEASVRRSEYTDRILLSNGVGISAGRQPLHVGFDTPKKRRSKRIMRHGGKNEWYIRKEDGIQRLIFDTNHWKTFLYTRLLQPVGHETSFSLFGKNPTIHQNIAEHLTAESPEQTEGQGRKLIEWTLKPGRDNHWLDTSVGIQVAASIEGAELPGEDSQEKRRQSRKSATAGISLAERKARKRRGQR